MSDLFKTLRQVVQKATINHEDNQKKKRKFIQQNPQIYLIQSEDKKNQIADLQENYKAPF